VLVATTITEAQLPLLPAWQAALAAQETRLLFDVALVDGTDFPTPGYVDHLREWARSRPLGPTHRVRLLRFGYAFDGRMFVGEGGVRQAWARQLLWGKFQAWASYERLMLLDVDLAIPPRTIERLYRSGQRWAVALLNGRVQPMRCALLTGEVVREVPFNLSTDGELEYSRACTERGIFPSLVPVTG
jgi:hypothetical protein